MVNKVYISDEFGLSALFNIIVVLAGILLAWWALQDFRLDVFLKNPTQARARVIRLMLAVALGYLFAKFIIEYAVWSSMLKLLF